MLCRSEQIKFEKRGQTDPALMLSKLSVRMVRENASFETAVGVSLF